MSINSTALPPVPYQSPVVGKNGIVTQVWADWFRQLLARVASLVAAGSGSLGTPFQESPSGPINGSNVTFVLSFTPASAADVDFYWDGVYQYQGVDYEISGTTITMASARSTGTPWAKYHH